MQAKESVLISIRAAPSSLCSTTVELSPNDVVRQQPHEKVVGLNCHARIGQRVQLTKEGRKSLDERYLNISGGLFKCCGEVDVHVRTYTYTHTYMQTHIHTRIHTFKLTYAHARMHTYTNTHLLLFQEGLCYDAYVCFKIFELCPQQDALAQSQQYWAREHWRACGGTRLQTRSTSIVADVSAALNWSVQPFCCNPSLCSFMHRFYKSEHIVMIFLLPLFAYLNHS